MSTILDAINKLEKLNRATIEKYVEKVILTDEELIDLKKLEFKKGVRPNGKKIGLYKSRSYSLFKERLNPLANGFIDLMNKGSFTNNLFIKKVSKSGFFFDSSDSKTDKLTSKHGIDIMGLNTETWFKHQKKIASKVYPLLKQHVGL